MPKGPKPPRYEGYIVFMARTGDAERLRGLIGTRVKPVTTVTRGDTIRVLNRGKRPLLVDGQADLTLLRFPLRGRTPTGVLASARAFINRHPKPARTRCRVELVVMYDTFTLNVSLKPNSLTLPGVDDFTISCYPAADRSELPTPC